jgi:hypothetical protein
LVAYLPILKSVPTYWRYLLATILKLAVDDDSWNSKRS